MSLGKQTWVDPPCSTRMKRLRCGGRSCDRPSALRTPSFARPHSAYNLWLTKPPEHLPSTHRRPHTPHFGSDCGLSHSTAAAILFCCAMTACMCVHSRASIQPRRRCRSVRRAACSFLPATRRRRCVLLLEFRDGCGLDLFKMRQCVIGVVLDGGFDVVARKVVCRDTSDAATAATTSSSSHW